MRYFCQYWKNEAEEHNREGTLLKYSFSSQFSKRGIQPGDAVYVVTVKAGELYLVGKMLVAGVGFREIAVRLKGRDAFWPARECIVAAKGKASKISFKRKIPLPLARELTFTSRLARRVPALTKNGKLDKQTFRNLRELTFESARRLDRYLRDC